MKELQELRNEILTLRNYGVINKEEEKSLLNKLNSVKEQLTIPDVVRSAFLVQHKDTLINYGLFDSEEKAKKYINNINAYAIQEVKIA